MVKAGDTQPQLQTPQLGYHDPSELTGQEASLCQAPFGSVKIFSAFLDTSHSSHIQKKSVQGKKTILPNPSLGSLLCLTVLACCEGLQVHQSKVVFCPQDPTG